MYAIYILWLYVAFSFSLWYLDEQKFQILTQASWSIFPLWLGFLWFPI